MASASPDYLLTVSPSSECARTFQNIQLFRNMTVLENVLVGGHSRMTQGIVGSVTRSPSQWAEEERARGRAMDLLSLRQE